jgi:uncharacterized membrane protein (UPF0127 family)
LPLKVMCNGKTISQNIILADTFWCRLAGLITRKDLQPDEGLLIRPCRQVHTWFMSFSLDIVFLDKEGKVIYLLPEMKPGKISPFIKESFQVLELAPGVISAHQLKLGEKLEIYPL